MKEIDRLMYGYRNSSGANIPTVGKYIILGVIVFFTVELFTKD